MPKLRAITVDGLHYRWRFAPRYEAAGDHWLCRDSFVAYAADSRRHPLRINFITWEDAVIGGPLRVGAPLLPERPELGGMNLHTPGWAARLIKAGLRRGWDPAAASLEIVDGLPLLFELLAEANQTSEPENPA